MLNRGSMILDLGCRELIIKWSEKGYVVWYPVSDEYERLREVWKACSIKQKKMFFIIDPKLVTEP